MKIIDINKVKTMEKARDMAKDWQIWAADQHLSYMDLLRWQSFFQKLGIIFNLTEEFEENGII